MNRKRARQCYVCGPTVNTRFRFPKEKNRLLEWRAFCNVTNKKLPESSRLCADHFKECDKIKTEKFNLLAPNAIPSIYTSSQLVRLKKSDREAFVKVSEEIELKSSIQKQFKKIKISSTVPLKQDILKRLGSTSEETINSSDTSYVDFNDNNSIFETSSAVPLAENTIDHLESTLEVTTDSSELFDNQVTPSCQSVGNKVSTKFQEVDSIETKPSVVRPLRFIGDIQISDLESPRRRNECLCIIRYQSKRMRSEIQNLKLRLKRLQKSNEFLKDLVIQLQHEKIESITKADDLLV